MADSAFARFVFDRSLVRADGSDQYLQCGIRTRIDANPANVRE